jgi:hypothetical protein
MSGVKVTNERPAEALADVESVDGVVVGEDVDWEPDVTTGIPPGDDPGDVLTWDGDSWEPEPPTSGTGLPWFNVMDPAYGAVNDDTTDDTTEINLAITALNAAGRGVLYFPAGAGYVTSGSLTTITVPALIMGDGRYTSSSGPITKITCTSTTASLFTVSANGCTFRDMALVNTNGSAKTAGAAITLTGGILADFERLTIIDFFDGVDIENSLAWTMRACYIQGVYRYGIRVRNTSNPDFGDWAIGPGVTIVTTHGSGTAAAVRMESSGGGKIVGLKVNGSATEFAYGIDVAITTGAATTILLVGSTSIENVSADAIRVTVTGSGQFGHLNVIGSQVGLYSNNTGRAVKITAANTGGATASGGFGVGIIDGCEFHTDGTARAAIELTKTDRVTLGDIQLSGFTSRYTSSGDTNTTDNAGVSFATPAIVLGTAAAAGAASTAIRSDSTIVAFDATTPTTQAVGDAGATGSAAVAARRDHKHPITRPSLDDLSDATITSPVTADRLRYDGAAWVNSALHWAPMMVLDPGTGNYLVLTDTSGNPIMAEV